MYNRAWWLTWKTVCRPPRWGWEFLMNIQVNTRRQKRKAPRLWRIHSACSSQRGDRQSQAHNQRDPYWSCGCFIAVSWCDCGLPWGHLEKQPRTQYHLQGISRVFLFFNIKKIRYLGHLQPFHRAAVFLSPGPLANT